MASLLHRTFNREKRGRHILPRSSKQAQTGMQYIGPSSQVTDGSLATLSQGGQFACWVRNRKIVGEISPLRCAGLNRHEAEEEEASRGRTSDPLGPEFCVGHREVHDEA